jgi:predicted proteasome-type protease
MFENDDEVDEYGNWTAHGIVKQVRTLLCIEGDSLVAPFWAGNLNGLSLSFHQVFNISQKTNLENQLLEYYHLVEASSMVTNDVGDMLHRDESSFYKDYLAREQQGFRLGFSDSEYRQ